MHYIAIATFSRDSKTTKEIFLRRRNYTYPTEFKNTLSFVDVQGGRAVIHFETTTAESIQFTWGALFLLGAALAPERPWRGGLLAGTAIALSLLTRGIPSAAALGTLALTSTLANAGLASGITAVDGSGNGSFTLNGVDRKNTRLNSSHRT